MLVSPKSFLLLLALTGFADALGGVVGRRQMGKLVCNGAAAADVKVKLYEDGTKTTDCPKMGSQRTISNAKLKFHLFTRIQCEVYNMLKMFG
ncbi:hypothetical protein L5515_012626 [Caenorhabditis briggsae]|uniref:Uncharacterized protein n=1 Tax=Caenorhabditis briggsae TaxID=6238 RepID=A0AAE9JHC5_CAEBR|nr:hypothetical protein L5515_012626 [Caenorhabditis briggsae]